MIAAKSVTLLHLLYEFSKGFPGGSKVKNLPANCWKCRFNSWVGKMPWRRKWQPTPVFLPGKSHWQRTLAGDSPWSRQRLRHGLATKQQLRWTSKHKAIPGMTVLIICTVFYLCIVPDLCSSPFVVLTSVWFYNQLTWFRALLILIHRRGKWSPRRSYLRSQPESTVGPGWTVAGGASSLCLLRVMPKTQPLCSVLNRRSETEVGEVEKKSFNALPGKGGHSEFLPPKTMRPHPERYGEKFYSQGSSGGGGWQDQGVCRACVPLIWFQVTFFMSFSSSFNFALGGFLAVVVQ